MEKDINIKNNLKIGFDYRGVVEMVNTVKGEVPIDTRLQSLFNVRQSKIHVKNIKRSPGYAAKAICVGSFDINTALRMGYGISKFGIVQDKMFWPVTDMSDKGKITTNIVRDNANIFQIFYSTNTLSAEVTIIPIITPLNPSVDFSSEYFEVNRDAIYELCDNKISELHNFISLIDACEFSNKTYKLFMNILSELCLILPSNDNFDFVEDYYNAGCYINLAKQYFTFNNTL